jgi:1-phosphofructokinase
MITDPFHVATITLNPAIDRTLVVPDFEAGRVHRVESEWRNAGGKGVNVAAALARAGHRVAVTGFLGRENTSVFEELFEAEGIHDSFLRIPGATRTGIKITDPQRQRTTDLNFPGVAPSWDDIEALRDAVQALAADWFVLSGSLPPGVDAAIYRDLTKMLKDRGALVALDASADPLRLAVEASPDLVKPNLHELEELVGHPVTNPSEAAKAAENLVRKGIGSVVVSLGAEGACFTTREGSILAVPPQVEVRTTVGAGDAMVAGILSSSLRRRSVAETARMATAFSLRAISEASLSTEEFAAQVSISQL